MTTRAACCHRCGQRYGQQDDWNAELRRGYVVALICPSCQTAEEYIESEINHLTSPDETPYTGFLKMCD